jgi:transcriptional regulator with XRE-family HTH domain
MTLGDIIKNLRIEKGLSQPEFSELAQIEQSYLSKLENNKSTPSADMFDRLLNAFNLTIKEFVSLFDKDDLYPLQTIPQVKQQLAKQTTKQFNKQRRHLYISCGLIVMAVTLFYTGFSKQLFNETVYQYTSNGLVESNEPDDIFSTWRDTLPTSTLAAITDGQSQYSVKRIEMTERKNLKHLMLSEYTGETLVKQEGDKRRFYRFTTDFVKPRLINTWLQIIAVVLFASGIMGFVIERRLYK